MLPYNMYDVVVVPQYSKIRFSNSLEFPVIHVKISKLDMKITEITCTCTCIFRVYVCMCVCVRVVV